MGIRILIVDDDKLLVNKLEGTLNWEKLGITMVFTAYNIRQAQKILEKYPVEILLCDIDMPQGSGLELLEWIRYRNLDIECAFLSSYANFAYAQMALKLLSREYLLKPVSNADLEMALGKIVEVVREKREIDDSRQERNNGTFWESLLVRNVQEEQMISKALEKGIYRKEDLICLVLFRILETPAKEDYKKNIALYNFTIDNIVTEFFKEGSWRLESVVHQSDLEWMLVLRDKGNGGSPEQSVYQMKEYLNGAVRKRCCVYVGEPGMFSEFPKSRERMECMEKYAVPDEEEILLEREWSFVEQPNSKAPWDAWLAEMERPDGVNQTRDEILAFLDVCKASGGLSTDFMRHFIHELLQTMYKYLNDEGIVFGQLFDDDEFEEYAREAQTSVMGSRKFINYLFEKLEGNKHSDDRQENVIEHLKVYIEQHLGEELSRDVLAKKVYLSKDYVSRLFVKVVGMSIPGYIAARRIERAKEYLRSSSLSISKIAMEVGYCNFSYFSKTFRDMVGYTPNEYRSRMRAEVENRKP